MSEKLNSLAPEVREKLARVKLLLMDVDGVLTDGKIYNVPGPDGKPWETKAFDSQDGIGLHWLAWNGIATGVISGRESPATEVRAHQTKMRYIYQGHIEKIPIIDEIMADCGVTREEIAYIGDDFTDVVVMRRVGLAIATANASPEVKSVAHLVTARRGGEGAVREVVELLLQARGCWDAILRKYEIAP